MDLCRSAMSIGSYKSTDTDTGEVQVSEALDGKRGEEERCQFGVRPSLSRVRRRSRLLPPWYIAHLHCSIGVLVRGRS